MGTHRRAAGLAVAGACVIALGGACTPAPAADPSSASTPSASKPSASTPSSALTIDIRVRGGQVTPNGKKYDVTRGQTVVLRVSSDVEDEVHAHTAGDGYELEVHPGQPAEGQFVATDTGTFEVELHHLDKIVAILVVR